MENKNVNKLPPQAVSERLSKDVHAILSVCIQHFEDAIGTEKEECFDVDAIVTNRSSAVASPYRRKVNPAAYSRSAESYATQPSSLSRSQKGYFIPGAYASHLAFA